MAQAHFYVLTPAKPHSAGTWWPHIPAHEIHLYSAREKKVQIYVTHVSYRFHADIHTPIIRDVFCLNLIMHEHNKNRLLLRFITVNKTERKWKHGQLHVVLYYQQSVGTILIWEYNTQGVDNITPAVKTLWSFHNLLIYFILILYFVYLYVYRVVERTK